MSSPDTSRRPDVPATLAAPGAVLVQVPLQLPSAEQMREERIEAYTRVERERRRWLTNEEAAAHLRMPMRTWERKKKELGVPVVKIDGLIRYLMDDLDAVMAAHSSAPATSVIKFPSLELRNALLRTHARAGDPAAA